jgi:integrase
MPRLVHKPPKYSKHKASGQAVVTIAGTDVYLGRYGSKESREAYDRAVAEWLAAGRSAPAQKSARALATGDGLSVATLLLQFWRHARTYYRDADGQTAGEAFNYRDALKPVLKLYGRTHARAFGPLALKTVREEMIRLKWSRSYINRQVLRIKSVFRWAAENELVAASVYESLRTVAGLRAGKSDARESAPVKPVDQSHAEAIFEFLPSPVQGLIQLQALTGARPGELLIMRTCDIDTTSTPWKFRPAFHKNTHRGQERIIELGPQAREIVAKFLKPDLQAYLFSPSEAVAERRRIRHEHRKTAMTCGNVPGSRRRRRPRNAPSDRYDPTTYRRAITRACDRAFPPPAELARQRVPAKGRKAKKSQRWETRAEWRARLGPERWQKLVAWQRAHAFHPHRLRHSVGTKLRAQFGLEASKVVLGHFTIAATQLYAEQNQKLAAEVAEKIG